MAIEKDVLDQLLAGRDPRDVFNKDGLVDERKKALSERILNTEFDEHLDDDSIEDKPNHRNGYSKKPSSPRKTTRFHAQPQGARGVGWCVIAAVRQRFFAADSALNWSSRSAQSCRSLTRSFQYLALL